MIGLKILKNKLCEYVRRVAQGETILIADRERVVAELVPPRETLAPQVADAVLADLVKSGYICPPLQRRGSLGPIRRPTSKFAELLEELKEDRNDR